MVPPCLKPRRCCASLRLLAAAAAAAPDGGAAAPGSGLLPPCRTVRGGARQGAQARAGATGRRAPSGAIERPVAPRCAPVDGDGSS